MKVFVVSELFGIGHVVTTEAIPNIGFAVDIFDVRPRLRVEGVLMWPNAFTLKSLNIDDSEIEAIVTVA